MIEKGAINFARYGTSLPSNALIIFLSQQISLYTCLCGPIGWRGVKVTKFEQKVMDSTCPRSCSNDVSSTVVKDAIKDDLAISVLSVQAENIDTENAIAELGRQWTVILSHNGQDVNIPQLQAITDGLRGHNSHVWRDYGV